MWPHPDPHQQRPSGKLRFPSHHVVMKHPSRPVREASEEAWRRVKTSVLPSSNEATSSHSVTRNHVDASDKASIPLGQGGISRAWVGTWGLEPHSAALQGEKGSSGVTWAFTTTWWEYDSISSSPDKCVRGRQLRQSIYIGSRVS